MTAKEVRTLLIKEMGSKEWGMDIYHQIQKMLKEEGKALNTIWWLKVLEANERYVHFEMNNGWYETALTCITEITE